MLRIQRTCRPFSVHFTTFIKCLKSSIASVVEQFCIFGKIWIFIIFYFIVIFLVIKKLISFDNWILFLWNFLYLWYSRTMIIIYTFYHFLFKISTSNCISLSGHHIIMSHIYSFSITCENDFSKIRWPLVFLSFILIFSFQSCFSFELLNLFQIINIFEPFVFSGYSVSPKMLDEISLSVTELIFRTFSIVLFRIFLF